MDSTSEHDVFSLKNNEFYAFIEGLVGQQIVDILKFQSIASTQSLIRNSNIFDIFNMKCSEPDFLSIRERSCLRLDDGQFIIKIGLVNNLNYLLDVLKQQQQKKLREKDDVDENPCLSLSSDFLDRHPLLKDLILYYQRVDRGLFGKDATRFLVFFPSPCHRLSLSPAPTPVSGTTFRQHEVKR